MKILNKITTLIFILLVTNYCFGQAPAAIPYQAVARDTAGNVVANHAVSVRFTIHNVALGGTVLYMETHNPTTNAQGLFSVNIGQGTVNSGLFANINWALGAKFLEVEFDPAGGTNFITMGTQQFMSVPYSFYSQSAGLDIRTFSGFISTINGSSGSFVFAGPTTSVIITSAKKITGAATAAMGLPTGSPQPIDIALCYQPAGGIVTNFGGISYINSTITSTRQMFSATYSIVLGAGTYNIGFGVRNSGVQIISNNDYVNGWIMITEP